jgi:membrane glycosyltransferase
VIYGFLTTLLGGDTAQIAHSLDEEPAGQETRPPTAIVLPIFNEDVDRVFRLVEAMWIGLRKAAAAKDLIFSS